MGLDMKTLYLKFPLVVAPMAGVASSVDFVVASCQAGALGSVGAAYSSPADIEKFVHQVREKTNRPIAINLFIPHEMPKISEAQIQCAIQANEKYRKKFGLPTATVAAPYEESFEAQFEKVMQLKPEVFSFVFGLLKKDYLRECQKQNIMTVGTATTLEEAMALQDSGVDAMALQGVEAGGHRGIFNPESDDPLITTGDLLKQCREKIKVPLIAAGGIMTSKDTERMLASGASAVQMGTAFLACQEAGTSAAFRKILMTTANRKTKLTRAFSGRIARGLENLYMTEMDQQPEAILPFQAQNKLTREMRNASAKAGSSDYLSLWCGTGQGDLWTGSVGDLIQQLFLDQQNKF